MAETEAKEAKKTRRNAKAALTRHGKALHILIEGKRSAAEVRDLLFKIEHAYDDLVQKHEVYTQYIDDDEEFDHEETWLGECQQSFLNLKCDATDYLKKDESSADSPHTEAEPNEGTGANPDTSVTEPSNDVVVPEPQSPDLEASPVSEPHPAADPQLVTEESPSANPETNLANPEEKPSSVSQPKFCSLKMEKPKLPKFSGDVREFFTFRSDFLHMVDEKYSKRDAIALLRTCLQGKPLDLIKGLGSDYEAAWEYLNSIYGDPRFVADIITQDIAKFKPLKENEDDRFCELVHLVKRSYNVLKEVGRPHDMDNNHMLAMIEKKMSTDDRKVWFRSLERDNPQATMENLMTWMTSEMKSRMRAAAPLRNTGQHTTPQRSHSVSHVTKAVSPSKKMTPSFKCWICQVSDHWVDQCPKLTSMSPGERLNMMKDGHACFSCLKKAGRNHSMTTCSKRRQCTEFINGVQCKSLHHPLLHAAPRNPTTVSMTTNSVGVATVNCRETLLPVIQVDVLGNNEHQSANVLLDTGAQISLIKTSLAEDLHLRGRDVVTTITKVGGEEEELHTRVYEAHIRPMNKKQVFTVKAVGIPSISDDVAEVEVTDIAEQFKIHPSDLHRRSGSIDLLIGIDNAKIHAGETREVGDLVARNSPLGWVIFGAVPGKQRQTNRVLHVKFSAPIDMTDFWTSEAMGVMFKSCPCKPLKLSPTEAEEARVIEESCTKVGKSWLIPYPWRKDPNLLPDNKAQAEKKLAAIERRLVKKPEHAEAYDRQIREMVDMSFARKLSQEEMMSFSGPVHYIAHHGVLRPENKSTPLRIVFNSSATFQGHCLNDYWMKGPDLLNNLFGVILRFRENDVAVMGDISKMYHRILIPEKDQHVHRFLWRDLEIDRSPDVYVKTVLTFGDKPAPAMAQIALKKTAEEGKHKCPEAARALTENVYMDDICDSTPTLTQAQKLTKDIDEILAGGGFSVKGWLSNKSLQVSSLEKEKRDLKPLQVMTEEKVLGTAWDPQHDVFKFKVTTSLPHGLPAEEGDQCSVKLTKRKILSNVAKIFDPVGFAAPIVIRAKIAMQHLWRQGLGWDQELPLPEQNAWIKLFDEMDELNDVAFTRSLTPVTATGDPMLCIFADASEDAFGACAYVRWQLQDGTFDVRFVAAKSRVAPLKKLTIPRLELQAAVVATRLYKTIMEETRFQIERTVFMTDSSITLGWVRGQARAFKPFVSNRVGEIQSTTDPSQWRHIPGEYNVADDVSRGIPVKHLTERWQHGPEFLRLPENEWPPSVSTIDQAEMKKEQRTGQSVFVAQGKVEVIDITKFSSWKKLVRVTAYTLRFAWNIKAKHQHNRTGRNGPLASPELQEAEKYLLLQAQKSLHDRLNKGEFKALSPFTDEDGILRVGGRLDASLMTYEAKHPALLPKEHHVSLLIMRQMHQDGHTGVATTVAKARREFWILKAHNVAKTVKFRCVPCREAEHKTETQLMADLPKERLAPYTPPFYFTACDYFGPYHVKIGRNKTTKHYGVIFTCLNTRAVHLELAVDCSTMEYLQVLRRFFAIRGYPALMISDNGTQLVGAERELRQMVQGWDAEKLKEFCAEKKMEWKFITPTAPHQNGCAESMVKSCKTALKHAVGAQVLTPFELYTVLLEVANLINQRPIGRLPNDPDDGNYLSPNDILLGRSSSRVPQGPFRETKNPTHRVEFIQKIVDAFWRRWSRDVLPLLVPRKRWKTEKRNIRVNDVVTVADPNAVRGRWSVGRVLEVYPGPDGKVRNVKVKTATGEYQRSIHKIAVLYPSEGYED